MRNALTLLVSFLVLAGCAAAPKDTYYTLSPAQPSTAPVAAMPDAVLVVGAARINEIVDRPQLVTRASENRVQILEQQRWAEPLKSGIARVVAADLSRLLGTTRVSAYPQAEQRNPGYRVALDVQRFDSRPGEGVNVEVAWTVRRLPGDEVRSGRSTVAEPAGSDYESIVAAFSRALAAVSGEIAAAIAANPR
jgi:uncharacterized lipoprotein YmbA